MKRLLGTIVLAPIFLLSGCSFSLTGYKDTYSCQSDVGGSCGSVSENLKRSGETNSTESKMSFIDSNKTTSYDQSSDEIKIYVAPYRDKNGVWHDESFVRVKK